MAHRAALYTVRVKEKWKDYKRLGDVDDAGTWLGAILEHELTDNFREESLDGEKVLQGLSATVDAEDDLRVVVQHGQSGVAADIVDEDGELQHRRTWTESELLRCCCVFRLGVADEVGWLASHVNNGHGVKGLLELGLLKRFAQRYPDLKLEINPFIQGATLQEAVLQGRVDKVRLTKLERPRDRANQATNKWVQSGDLGKLELEITSRGEGGHLIPTLLQRFIRGDRTVMAEIIEFQGITFDEASVEVTLPNGTKRLFNIEKPDSGHAMTMDLTDLDFDAEGEPSEESVVAGLKSALEDIR